jgi:hypothetical protein
MGPKLPFARSTVPDDALVEDGAGDAAGALAPVVVCLLELLLPHAATAIALKATAVAAASGARRLLRIVTPSLGLPFHEKSRQRGSRLVKRSYGRAARDVYVRRTPDITGSSRRATSSAPDRLAG